MDRYTSDLYDRCAALRERSARLRIDVARLHALIESQVDSGGATVSAIGGAIYDAPAADPHAEAMEALRLIRTIVDPFPLEWQIAIVKALTARTLVKAHQRTQPAPTTLSA